jgi:CRISPR/Cas system-associated exonuclease Cas4 (RecB family)
MHLDAVRLLTIHASKGLEFAAVYLPGLNQGTFPASRQWQPCPPPAGMLALSTRDEHDEEEECLFFVALSRARDVLCLSHTLRNGDRNSTPSQFLALVESCLPTPVNHAGTFNERHRTIDVSYVDPPPSVLAVFDVEALDLYLRCPRQYYYEYVLGLHGRRMDSGYIEFHRCVYGVLSWLQEKRTQGYLVREEDARMYLATLWEEKGLRNHPHEEMYRAQAELLVMRAFHRVAEAGPRLVQAVWEVPLTYGRVRFLPDAVEFTEHETGTSVVVERVRTGRPSQSERNKDIYALYQRGAEQAYPTAKHKIQVVYLSGEKTEEVKLVQKTIATRLGHYDAAMAGILRADFPAQPQDRECPRCPHYYICPVAEDA